MIGLSTVQLSNYVLRHVNNVFINDAPFEISYKITKNLWYNQKNQQKVS